MNPSSHLHIIYLPIHFYQVVLDNPTTFNNPFQFEITFECLQELEDDLEWKVLYVGSAHDASKDQTLDEILVGPIPVGVNKFVLQADAPDPNQLPPDEILGVTVVLVTCSYREREFIRVGYYVNNEYVDPNPPPPPPPPPQPVQMGEDGQPLPPPPAPPAPAPPKYPQLDLNHVHRQILADKPRVTKFAIPWTEQEAIKEAEAKAKAAAEGSPTGVQDAPMVDSGGDDDDNDDGERNENTPMSLPPSSAAHGMNLMAAAAAATTGGSVPMDME